MKEEEELGGMLIILEFEIDICEGKLEVLVCRGLEGEIGIGREMNEEIFTEELDFIDEILLFENVDKSEHIDLISLEENSLEVPLQLQDLLQTFYAHMDLTLLFCCNDIFVDFWVKSCH